MGLGDFLEGAGKAVVNVAKGAAWVARPDHWDDIAEGVGKAGEYVVEHPGKAWDTAFEVGRAVVKDQLDPVNLAINAGLLAATVATGGAAAPAFIAKMGLTAKSVEAGVSALKVADTVGDVAKGVSTATKAVEAGSTALKAADTAGDVARGVRTGAKALDTVGDVAKGVDAATDAGQAFKGGSKALELADKALGMNPNKYTKTASNIINPLENSRFGMAAMRERGAAKMLEAGGEAPSLARQAGAALLQGGGRGAGGPAQLAGMSDKVYEAQKWAQRGKQVGKRLGQAEKLGRGVEVAADPMGYAQDKAFEEMDRRGVGSSSGYEDRGATAESLYGDTSQTAAPGRSSSFSAGASQAQSPYATSSVGGTGGPSFTPGGTGNGGGPPPSSTGGLPTNPNQPSKSSSPNDPLDERLERIETLVGGRQKQHLWEGPRSQALGGIQANYDWRPVEPLRPINSSVKRKTGEDDGMTPGVQSAGKNMLGDDLNGQGAPENFSPEVPKSGMYALSTGQQPAGSAFPALNAGPTVRAGSRAQGRTMHAQNVRTATQPIGAIGPGKRTGNAVIDADSSSPNDLGFDNAGQGYFNFANMGSGTADVGEQPNTSPMYAQGSRTSRRSAGMLGV